MPRWRSGCHVDAQDLAQKHAGILAVALGIAFTPAVSQRNVEIRVVGAKCELPAIMVVEGLVHYEKLPLAGNVCDVRVRR